jgi:RND family efflux transporter MFP subunit
MQTNKSVNQVTTNMGTTKMKPVFKHAAIVIALVATFGGAAMMVSAADDKAPATAKAALTVTTTRPTPTDLAIKLSANGNIAAWQETIVGAEVNGLRLTDVRVNVGDIVKRGQVLASFAPETINAELAQQRASVAEAEASLAEANANAERARTLEASGALSAQQINQYVTAAKTAEARLAAARAVATTAQIRLKNTRVLAPDDGVISARAATVGAIVQAGQEMFKLIRNNRLEWRAELTSTELDKISIGQQVTVTTPAGTSVAGRVRAVAPTVDAQTRQALVYVDLLNEKKDANFPAHFPAKAGMYAKGEFALGSSNALTVPSQAVVVRDGFNYVFEIKADNRVGQRKVVVGRRTAERTEIISGLSAETSIVAGGAGFLNDGDLVAINSATAPSPTPVQPSKTPASTGVSEQKAVKTPVK